MPDTLSICGQMGEMIEEAGKLVTAAPPAEASLPPSEAKATEGESPDQAQATEQGEQSGAPAANGDKPAEQQTSTNHERRRGPGNNLEPGQGSGMGRGLEKDIRETYRPVYDEIESLGGVDPCTTLLRTSPRRCFLRKWMATRSSRQSSSKGAAKRTSRWPGRLTVTTTG